VTNQPQADPTVVEAVRPFANALNRVVELAGALTTRYPDASPELQAVLTAIATDIRATITDALKGDQA
jgi:hypothetical protein